MMEIRMTSGIARDLFYVQYFQFSDKKQIKTKSNTLQKNPDPRRPESKDGTHDDVTNTSTEIKSIWTKYIKTCLKWDKI